MERQPRRDAQRNRALLLASARAVFEEEGLDASVDRITEHAGLGTGTLYRHFPTREALVAALFEERADEFVAIVARALGHEDAAKGLRRMFEEIVALQCENRILRELMLRHSPPPDLIGEARAKVIRLSEDLLAKAKAQRIVRGDFTVTDLALLFWSLRPIVEGTSDLAPSAWRRHLGFVLDGLRPAAATEAAAAPLTATQLEQATERLRARRPHRAPRAPHSVVRDVAARTKMRR